MLIKESIKDNDLLDLTKSILEGIGVSTSFGAINYLNVGDWILAVCGKGFDVTLQQVVFNWIKLVEQRHDHKRSQNNHDQHEHCDEKASVNKEVLSSFGNDCQQRIVNDWRNDQAQNLRDHHIFEKSSELLLVKTMVFSNNKV